MDGRVVNEGTVGDGGHSVAARGFVMTETLDEGARGVGRSQGSGCMVELGGARRGALPGRDLSGLGGTVPMDDLSYVHVAVLCLSTHVVQGCLASHLCGRNQPSRLLGSARGMPPLTFFPRLIAKEPCQVNVPEITACNNLPTRKTRLTHSQGVPGSPLLHREVMTILDVHNHTSSAPWSTRDASLRGRSAFA
jgi:hypothetical protein